MGIPHLSLFSRGSEAFDVSIGETSLGPWTTIAKGTFPDLRSPKKSWNPERVPLTVIQAEGGGSVAGRFVKYECTTFYGDACALHYIGLLTATPPEPEAEGMLNKFDASI